MESFTEEITNENKLKKTNTLTLKSCLSLSNQKLKTKNYYTKKSYFHTDSYKKGSESGEYAGLTRINSMTASGVSQLPTTNKKPKGRVCFAPKYRLIDYVYYNPNSVIIKEENNIINEEEVKKDENNDVRQKNEAKDKVEAQCSCFVM